MSLDPHRRHRRVEGGCFDQPEENLSDPGQASLVTKLRYEVGQAVGEALHRLV